MITKTEAIKRLKECSCSAFMRDAINMGLEALEHEGRWTSVDDGLPKEYGAYLVYAPDYSGGSSSSLDNINGVMFSRWLKRKNENNGAWSIEVGYHKRPGCVKAWMPLPEPPKED